MRKFTLLLVLFLSTCFGLSAQENLIQGGDFDRANWQDGTRPDFWLFDKVKLNHLEAPSYEGNKGWCYIEVTPKTGGKMRNYKDDDNMLPNYASMKVATGTQLKVVFWAKSEVENTIQVSIPWYDADLVSNEAWTSADLTLKGGVWKKYTVYTAVAPENISQAGITVFFTSTNGTVSFDDFAIYETDGTQAEGKVIVELEDGTLEGGNEPEPDPVLTNLMTGGDFDRANWQDGTRPDFWLFDKVKLNHLEAPSYEGNQGWCYIEITPQAGGKMTHYKDGDNMEADFASLDVKGLKQLQVVFWTKSETANTIQLSIPWYDAAGQQLSTWTSADIKVEGNVWKKYTVYTAAVPEGAVKAGLATLFTSTNGKISFDDFAVYAASGAEVEGDVTIELEDGSQEPGGSEGGESVDGNLFKYGDFEQVNPMNSKPMGWYIPNTALFYFEKNDLPAESTGKQAIRIYPNTDVRIMTNYEGKEDILAVEQGRTYDLFFYAKANNVNDKVSVRFQFYANGEESGTPLYVAEDVSFTNEWQLYMYEFTAPYEINSASCTISFSTDNDFVYFDDIQMFVRPDEGGGDEVTPIEGVVRVDNLFYLLQGDHAVVSPEADQDGINYNEANRPTGDIVIPASIEVEGVIYPVTEIAASAFDECPGITSVKMPDTITKIGNYAFEYCDGLETIEISKNLVEVGFYAFYQCPALRSVVLPATLKNIGDNAFGECTGLETFEMLSTDPASITTGKDIFFHVDRDLVVLKVPAGSEDTYANLYPWSSFKKIETGIFGVESAAAQVELVNGQLTVNAQQPVQVTICDLSGKLVYSALVQQGIVNLEKGVYVVKFGNKIHKLLVK